MKTLVVDDKTVAFQLWDTAGQERLERHVVYQKVSSQIWFTFKNKDLLFRFFPIRIYIQGHDSGLEFWRTCSMKCNKWAAISLTSLSTECNGSSLSRQFQNGLLTRKSLVSSSDVSFLNFRSASISLQYVASFPTLLIPSMLFWPSVFYVLGSEVSLSLISAKRMVCYFCTTSHAKHLLLMSVTGWKQSRCAA